MRTYEEPFVVTVSKPYDVPTITFIDTFEEVPVEKYSMRTVDIPTTIQVMIERRVPVIVEKNFTIDVPVEQDHEIIQQIAQEEEVTVEKEEPIPSPPCHWHSITHTHKVCENCLTKGLTHTHDHKALHPKEEISEDDMELSESEMI